MKYLKLFEYFEDIDSICEKYKIKNYTVNGDGSIDVDGNVELGDFSFDGLNELPLKFRNVSGNFYCHDNKLTTLDGCPESIGGDFNCSDNKIVTFVGGPTSISRDFHCGNNKLISLEGCPKSINRDFYCVENKIRTFEGFPSYLGGDFYCLDNPVWSLWRLFEDKGKIELFNDFGITDGEVVILERLNEFLEMIGSRIIDNKTDIYIKNQGYKII